MKTSTLSFVMYVLFVIFVIYVVYSFQKRVKAGTGMSIEDFRSFERSRYDASEEQVPDDVDSLQPSTPLRGANKVVPLPKIIFMYWHEEVITDDLVKRNVEYIRRILPKDFELRVYNEKSIEEEFARDKVDYAKYKRHQVQQYADFIRVYLLKKYGGVWMDASIIIFDFDFILEIYRDYERSPFDVFMFEYKIRNGGDGFEQKYLENWFIVAPKGSPFIADLFREYKDALDQGLEVYKKQLDKEGVDFKNTIEGEGNVYLMQHTIVRKLLMLYDYRLNLGEAGESMFKFQDECRWDGDCLIQKMMDKKSRDGMYAVKLVGGHRSALSQSQRSKELFDAL